jgi:hypothetical protein
VIDRVAEQRDDLLVVAEAREVLERQVDGSTDATRAAQRPQLVQLALMT